jgi:hypothetical protein
LRLSQTTPYECEPRLFAIDPLIVGPAFPFKHGKIQPDVIQTHFEHRGDATLGSEFWGVVVETQPLKNSVCHRFLAAFRFTTFDACSLASRKPSALAPLMANPNHSGTVLTPATVRIHSRPVW